MPRRVQDIVPGGHRSIREVPIEHATEKKRTSTAKGRGISHIKKLTKEDEAEIAHLAKADTKAEPKKKAAEALIEPPPPPPSMHVRPKARKGNFRWMLVTFGIILVVAAVGFVASTYFSRATFTIVPKSVPVAVNGTIVAQHAASATAGDGLIYETITVRSTATTTVPASDGPSVSTKAQGRVTIYNAYSESSQQLIAGTRIANSSGKVYRLTGSVVVPGYSENRTPGSVVATVVADQPGQLYNINKGEATDDFKFLGYQGTPRYDSFYARLASDITGGYEGKKKTVAESTIASSTATLKALLTASLTTQAEQAIPEGYIMFDSMYTVSFSEPNVGGDDPTKAEISLAGTFNGIIFKKDKLASRLAGNQAVSSFGKFDFDTPGMESLTMTIANPKDFSPERKTSLLIRGNGNFKIRGIIPVTEIKDKLAGVPLAYTQEILQDYAPIIQSGAGELVPPWAKVPSDPSRITITVKEE
jgi:hypothetical protein